MLMETSGITVRFAGLFVPEVTEVRIVPGGIRVQANFTGVNDVLRAALNQAHELTISLQPAGEKLRFVCRGTLLIHPEKAVRLYFSSDDDDIEAFTQAWNDAL